MKRTPLLFTLTMIAAMPLAGCAMDPGEEGDDNGMGEVIDTSDDALTAYCDDVLNPDAAWVSFESQVLTLTNQKRAAGATCGTTVFKPAGALTSDARLQCAARKHSKDLATHNIFSHTGSDGSSFTTRMKNAGYTSFSTAGENIAAGQSTPASVVDGWMKSEGHCKNIMNPALKQLGVGYSFSSTSTYKHYWTQDFATPLGG